MSNLANRGGKPTILTDERFAAIPGLIAEGLTKYEIAAMYGVTPATLQVRCSQRGISLRPGGPYHKRVNLTIPTEVPDERLPISEQTLKSLRQTARAMGRDTARLVSDLLEKIASDHLYNAVLDEMEI